MNKRIEIIKNRMEKELSCSAHNIDHVMRVFNLSKLIAKTESKVDMNILEPAALLHDIARTIECNDTSGKIDHAILGSEMAVSILKELNYTSSEIEQIQHCISTHRYRTNNIPQTIEAKILFDADKLDVIGSVGIARTFMLAGQFGQRITATSNDEYDKENIVKNGRIKDVSKHSPFMEYEFKFKKVPQKLFTKEGKRIGEKKLKYMEQFFSVLDKELSCDI
jgi:uncharacterized protein